MRIKNNYPLAVITSIAISLCSSLNAQPGLTEDFESYSLGLISGQPSATPGLKDRWIGNASAEVVADKKGKALRVMPDGQWLSVAFDLSGYNSPFAGNKGILGAAAGSTLFVSFDLEFESTKSENAQAYFALSESPGTEQGLLFGQIWNNPYFSGAFGSPSKVPLETDAIFFVIQLTRQGGGSVAARIYKNPDHPFITALTGQTPLVTLWPKENDFRFLQFKANANSFIVDSIRIGQNPEDVFPD